LVARVGHLGTNGLAQATHAAGHHYHPLLSDFMFCHFLSLLTLTSTKHYQFFVNKMLFLVVSLLDLGWL
jgi:hypothetical protein